MAETQKECPSCAMMIDKSVKVCPICQYEFPQPNRWYQLIALLLLLLFLLFYIL